MNPYKELGFSGFGEFYQHFLEFSQAERKKHANRCPKILDKIVIEEVEIPEDIRKRDVKKPDKLGEVLKRKSEWLQNGKFVQSLELFKRFLQEIDDTGYDPQDDINTILQERVNGYNASLFRIDPDNCPHSYLLYIYKEREGESEFVSEDELVYESLDINNFDEAVKTYFAVLKYLKNH